jgi:hypothetical protein
VRFSDQVAHSGAPCFILLYEWLTNDPAHRRDIKREALRSGGEEQDQHYTRFCEMKYINTACS